MKVNGAEEVMKECSDDVDIITLQNDLKSKLKTEVVVRVENNEVNVQRLLID